MNWSKVNGILIGAFVIINICLGLILYQSRTKYEVTGTRLTELQINLDRYHIAMYDFIPNYEPMQRLGIVRKELNSDQIAKAVFEESDYNSIQINGTKEYTDGKRRLIFYQNQVNPDEFIYVEPFNIYTASKSIIEEYADNLVKKFYNKRYGLERTSFRLKENGFYEIIYMGFYEDTPIYGSYIKIVVNTNSSVTATIKLIEAKDFIKEKHNLVEPEEMLYNLGERIGKGQVEQTIIKEIDIGYDAGDRMFQEVKQDYIEPYYRIELLNGKIYYINAYTNEIVN